MFVLGTRPEVIKMAPLIKEAAGHRDEIESIVCLTAQHRDMVDPLIDYFGIEVNCDLDIMVHDQSVFHVVTESLKHLDEIMQSKRPHLVIVQGDTTTTFAVSLAAFYHRIPVAHVEAGLRTYERYFPFPEEKHRQMTSVLSTYHFAPTEDAKTNLISEGIHEDLVHVTGNTVIDALKLVLAQGPLRLDPFPDIEKVRADTLLLVTAHRRESIGPPLEGMCRTIERLVDEHPGLHVVFPVHPNPRVARTVRGILGGHGSITLTKPFIYPDFVHLIKRADLIMTDSGGIQEEACYLGRHVVLMRDFTERPEALSEGFVTLAGRDEEELLRVTSELITCPPGVAGGSRTVYGDGESSRRIVRHILDSFEELTSGGYIQTGRSGSPEKSLFY